MRCPFCRSDLSDLAKEFRNFLENLFCEVCGLNGTEWEKEEQQRAYKFWVEFEVDFGFCCSDICSEVSLKRYELEEELKKREKLWLNQGIQTLKKVRKLLRDQKA